MPDSARGCVFAAPPVFSGSLKAAAHPRRGCGLSYLECECVSRYPMKGYLKPSRSSPHKTGIAPKPCPPRPARNKGNRPGRTAKNKSATANTSLPPLLPPMHKTAARAIFRLHPKYIILCAAYHPNTSSCVATGAAPGNEPHAEAANRRPNATSNPIRTGK